MEKELVREKLRERTLSFYEDKKDIILEYCTGSGKTALSLHCIRSKDDGRGKILVTVPETNHIENFKEDVVKHGFGYMLDRMDIICYASLKKYCGGDYKYWIADEIHNCVSRARVDHASKIKAEYSVGLSATLDEDVKEALEEVRDFEIISYTYKEAVNDGLLPPVDTRVIRVRLDDTEKVWEYKFKNGVAKLTALEFYQQISKSVKYWADRYDGGKGEAWAKNKMLQAGSMRQRFLGEYKTKRAQQILDRMGDKRAIIFCASKDQAHRLGGEDAVSSDNSKKVNREIITSFNNGERNKLFAKGMLVEGMNLVNTPYCLMLALGNKELRAVQATGRILRDDNPCMIIVVVEGTVDEKFLMNSYNMDVLGEKLDY